MRGRQVCWSDPKLQALAKKFVPAADEVWRLHNRKELDCLFFQGFCEEGHYGNRNRPTTTRQGIYCCSPSGRFLASVNTTDPRRMARMLEEALEAWKAMPKKERYLDEDPAAKREEIRRWERLYPEDGLALRVYTRDPKRAGIPNDWRKTAWNVDSLWIRKDEMEGLVPARRAKGASAAWPEVVIRRLVRHHLVDNARGQTNGYRDGQVLEADMTSTVTKVAGTKVHLAFEGRSRTSTTGRWPTDGTPGSAGARGPHDRGVQTRLLGEAVWDRREKRFVSLEISALGTRWGQTQFNFRREDVEEAPIAFAVVLDAEDPGNRVAPAELGAYGWR